MDNIKISLLEVSNCSQAIIALNNKMYDLLQNIKKDMNDLNSSWISESGETIRQRFNQFANKFEIQKETIDSYSKFLDLTVSSYDSLETTINANASRFSQ